MWETGVHLYCVKLHCLISLFEVGLHANCFVVGLYQALCVLLYGHVGGLLVATGV